MMRGPRLRFVLVPDWPMLAWLARCEPGGGAVTVFHGARVETADDWFCEAAWAGEYEAGGFDLTDIVAGSGGRVRDGRLTFVSSGSTVDRLHSFEARGATWVSNSLACLLAATGARIDPTSGKYFWIFRTVVGGLAKYRREFPTSGGDVRLTYFDNLEWDGRRLSVRRKPGGPRDFSTFERYAAFLDESMRAVGENAAARERQHRYELMSTASSGYDSSTITVLARRAGATRVLCFDQARRNVDDSGEPLARCIGMEPVVARRDGWTSAALPEPPFIAADSYGGDVFFKGAERLLEGKVLLTGYHGDKVWAKDAKKVDENIVRGDQSGLSLTEYRLTIGMLHCPVAFWGVRQIADLHRISNSPEMAPWDVPGDYSRPICRRIVESAGVPRHMFGMEKKASWVMLLRSRQFLSPGSMDDYIGWLAAQRWDWARRGRVPPVLSRRLDLLEVQLRNAFIRVSDDSSTWWTRAAARSGASRVLARAGAAPTYLRRFIFAWAMDHHVRTFQGAVQ
jgi:hypothetical protein